MNRAPLLSTCISLAIGVVIAAIVACGGASKSAAPVAVQHPGSAEMPTGRHDPRIEELDAKITADYKNLEIGERPTTPPNTCVVNCGPDMQPLAVEPKPSDDPKCVKGESDKCKDSWKLGDEICSNATQICKIAEEPPLSKNDAWANGKCADGETSCKKARQHACGCQ